MVARRHARCARAGRAVLAALPRGHQPGAHDLDDGRGRPVVRPGRAPVDRLAWRMRAGVVARRHEDGRDLRGRAVGVERVARWRTARAAPPCHVRERARAELDGRLEPPPLPVTRRPPHRQHRDGRKPGRAARPGVDARHPRRADGGARGNAARHDERRREGEHGCRHRRQPHHAGGAARRTPARRRPCRRRVVAGRDARPCRVPLAPAEGLRRGGGPRLARLRHHHHPESRQYAVRSRRRPRGQRGGRAPGAARVRDRLPDGVAAGVLQDGHRDLEPRAPRDGTRARARARARPDQELRAPARPAAEADGRVRAWDRRAGRDARDLPRGPRRRRQHRAHRRVEPARLLAEDRDAPA